MHPYGIGIVGLGQITEVHRDGYRTYGLPTVAGFDISEKARTKFAEQDPQARIYDRIEDLFEDPAVKVIDLATPQFPEARFPAIELAAKHRKPVLIQKPLGHTYADALHIAETLLRAGVPAMVNQNLVFAGGMLEAAHAIVREKVIGTPYLAMAFENWCSDQPAQHWFGKGDRWWVTNLTVHVLSVLHLLLGPPDSVYAALGRDPAQPGVEAEGFGHLLLRYPEQVYPDGMVSNVYSSGTYYGLGAKVPSPFIQGTKGVVNLSQGHGYTLSLRTDKETMDEKVRHRRVPTRSKWFPNAFGLAMAHFQQAILAQQPPLCSVEDNLYVMAVCEAAHMSHARRAAVSLAEVMGDRFDPSYGPGYLRGYTDWTPPHPLEDIKLIRGEYDWN